MEKNIFKLDNEQLKGIAYAFREKVEEGLSKKNAEIQCIPTFILPKAADVKGKALVLDLGGTNYRVAIVDFTQEKPVIYPNNGWKKDMSVMKSPGYTREELFKELADLIVEIKREEEMPIGYCFSYPAESVPGGDAKLLRWTKGVDIRKMVGQFVGKPLLDYLNEKNEIKFTGIKVLNDTIASLFAGLTDKSYDAYIGLIVGTGTNMATFIPADKIKKLDPAYSVEGLIPVNLESGNFHPPFLTAVDDTVDAMSDSMGKQRFEKAVSGMYLGDILKAAFPLDEFEEKFDARKLTAIMNYPDIHKDIYVQVARWIYSRSAQLVAASLAGLIALLKSYNKDIHRICLIAEGSLFWSESRKDKSYNILVMEKLQELLRELQLEDVEVHINNMSNANLIGTGIAALT
ncbi:hexokinase [Bacteroides fragilis]|uniref:Hexokinase n=1 Tax=Bacteroides fragilis TaxID=817 RepID=A0A396C379_BACFG|nr:hexokinase [Bacteroides fragilis]MCM0219263.1 hexokinase [Bacteroides fragilis]MCM0266336.1 hexokinase [Bacteroides fragilis]MCM0295474.1 hexokinase [Bacteroides fragilis]RHH15473.1 hexokinase [Bacteroides fragilis]